MECLKLLIDLLIGSGLIYVGWSANRIARSNYELARQEQENRKYRINKHEREVFLEVYKMLSDAIRLVWESAVVNEDSKKLFWQARDRARLELPDEIVQYTQNLFDIMYEAYLLNISLRTAKEGGLKKGKERTQKSEERMQLIDKILKQKPYEIFRKYLSIK